ncbi:hypothetical protein CBFG_04005 [Clostridiales bacterium 1_7_47FAA]|nr:hypothetical protein CBFG_04005 [Clostridiales bacterium 1_7_47FAA]
MPISCGFAGPDHGTICHLMATEIAIQAMKNINGTTKNNLENKTDIQRKGERP